MQLYHTAGQRAPTTLRPNLSMDDDPTSLMPRQSRAKTNTDPLPYINSRSLATRSAVGGWLENSLFKAAPAFRG